jgi:UDP-N-acetylglucosamine 2-epimerase
MVNFKELCRNEKPYLVIVIGDVNVTPARSVVATKHLIKVVNVISILRAMKVTYNAIRY